MVDDIIFGIVFYVLFCFFYWGTTTAMFRDDRRMQARAQLLTPVGPIVYVLVVVVGMPLALLYLTVTKLPKAVARTWQDARRDPTED